MSWFKKRDEEEKEERKKRAELKLSEQLWTKCNSCNEIIYRKVIERSLQVCPKCNYHFQIPARKRIECVADPGTFIEYDADLVSAEPKAMIGFVGPRVIKDTIRSELPEGFQRAEYLLEHGMVDLIVERKDLRHTLASLLEMLMPDGQKK